MLRRIVFIVSFVVALSVSSYVAGYARAHSFGISPGGTVFALVASLLLTSITLGSAMIWSERSLRAFVAATVGVAVCAVVLANLWCYADERSFLSEATRSSDYATRKSYARARRFPHRSFGLVLSNGEPTAHE